MFQKNLTKTYSEPDLVCGPQFANAFARMSMKIGNFVLFGAMSPVPRVVPGFW